MSTCDADSYCIHSEFHTEVVPEFYTKEIGIPVVLVNSVQKNTCKQCGEVLHNIQFPERLIAAAAVTRVQIPTKLKGDEIRFLRKAIKWSATELANFLEVAPETLSRCENDKLVMGPATERVFRAYVGVQLRKKAPAIVFNVDEVLSMRIKGIRHPSTDEDVMEFQLMLFKAGVEDEPAEEYTKKLAA